MSLMGYEERHIDNMILAIETATDLISDPTVNKYLLDTADLLNGMLAEGRV